MLMAAEGVHSHIAKATATITAQRRSQRVAIRCSQSQVSADSLVKSAPGVQEPLANPAGPRLFLITAIFCRACMPGGRFFLDTAGTTWGADFRISTTANVMATATAGSPATPSCDARSDDGQMAITTLTRLSLPAARAPALRHQLLSSVSRTAPRSLRCMAASAGTKYDKNTPDSKWKEVLGAEEVSHWLQTCRLQTDSMQLSFRKLILAWCCSTAY